MAMRKSLLSGEHESDVDCTAKRVASVTLESDSLSEAPMSLRHKRRRRLPKRERVPPLAGAQRMDVDQQQQLLGVSRQSEAGGAHRPQQQPPPPTHLHMDWKASTSEPSSGSDDSLGYGADGEQSDWPAAEEGPSQRRGAPMDTSALHAFRAPPTPPPPPQGNPPARDGCHQLASTVARRIERFLADGQQRELILNHVHHASALKRTLKASAEVQLLKRGRGTLILKKL